jgi:hypothetical protein
VDSVCIGLTSFESCHVRQMLLLRQRGDQWRGGGSSIIRESRRGTIQSPLAIAHRFVADAFACPRIALLARPTGLPPSPDTLTLMTLRRWRIRFFVSQTVMMFGILIAASFFRDGDPAWMVCAAAAVVGLTVMVIASVGWRRAEKQEAARLAAAPPAPPDPRRWRVVEMRENDD